MQDLKLYQLREGHLEKTLPLLIAKIYESGKSINIVSENKDYLQNWDILLWTYTPISFLPHGCEEIDQNPEHHPIWLSRQPVKNKDILVLFCDFLPQNLTDFTTGVLLFQTEKEKEIAETIAKKCPTAQIKRWIQTEKGWDFCT